MKTFCQSHYHVVSPFAPFSVLEGPLILYGASHVNIASHSRAWMVEWLSITEARTEPDKDKWRGKSAPAVNQSKWPL